MDASPRGSLSHAACRRERSSATRESIIYLKYASKISNVLYFYYGYSIIYLKIYLKITLVIIQAYACTPPD